MQLGVFQNFQVLKGDDQPTSMHAHFVSKLLI